MGIGKENVFNSVHYSSGYTLWNTGERRLVKKKNIIKIIIKIIKERQTPILELHICDVYMYLLIKKAINLRLYFYSYF